MEDAICEVQDVWDRIINIKDVTPFGGFGHSTAMPKTRSKSATQSVVWVLLSC